MIASRPTNLILFFIGLSLSSFAQSNPNDHYYQLSDYTDAYSAGMVASRMIDGLGFRYYWGSVNLRQEDLDYRPSEGARSLEETIDHIANLSAIIRTTVEEKIFTGISITDLSYHEKRKLTLENLKIASVRLQHADDAALIRMRIQFGNTDLPFWNLLNGPIADAINHVGQIIRFRRSNGNPINPNISVLTGSVN